MSRNGNGSGPALELQDIVLAHLRPIELQARLLLIASALEGFQLQAADVRCLGLLMADSADKIKTLLTEV